jgi:hypothetical protein
MFYLPFSDCKAALGFCSSASAHVIPCPEGLNELAIDAENNQLPELVLMKAAGPAAAHDQLCC